MSDKNVLLVFCKDPTNQLSSAYARAAEIFGPLDVDKDGEITMDEFVDGYMKIHTSSNGKRRWSRKASAFQSVSEDDLEKLRQKMDSALSKDKDTKTSGKPGDKKAEEKTKNENEKTDKKKK